MKGNILVKYFGLQKAQLKKGYRKDDYIDVRDK